MAGAIVDQLRLVGAAGTNKIMAGELSRLAGRAFNDFRPVEPHKEGPGSVVYPFDVRLAALAVRYHRTSARVLWDLYRSSARRLEPLYADLMQAIAGDERPWFSDGARITVRTFHVEEFQAGERQVVGTVKNALIDGFAKRGIMLRLDPDSPDLHFSVRLFDDVLHVSLDLAGRPMHERGYRQVTTEAPLREDLAANLIMFSRYDARRDVLLDPMAGSGTLPIEAAGLARARPIWHSGRRPAALAIPAFSEILAGSAPPLFADTAPQILANEIDPTATAALRANAETAGEHENIIVTQGDFELLSPASVEQALQDRGAAGGHKSGIIVANPPYGERMSASSDELRQLYRRFGAWCGQFHGWRGAFLVANPDFEREFGIVPRKKKPMSNGPLRGYFYYYEF